MSLVEEIDKDVTEFKNKKLEMFKYHLGGEVYVTANGGFPVVHIRLYYKNEDMSISLPTKVGLALRYEEWDALVKIIEDVQERMKQL